MAYKTSSKCTCKSCSIPAKGYYRIATYRRVIVLVYKQTVKTELVTPYAAGEVGVRLFKRQSSTFYVVLVRYR